MSSNARASSVDSRDNRTCTSEGLHSSLSTVEEADETKKTLKQKDERPIVSLLKSTDEHTFGICLVL